MKALIGYTGFVGSNLVRQTAFDHYYRSTDIGEIAGRTYDLIVCAGAPAEKWRANTDPVQDLAAIQNLMSHLDKSSARKLVLISTVDVYPYPVGVDEESPILPAENHPYGQHRYLLEQFVRERFDATVVRLPGLFGTGLKKNVIFDMLHRRPVQLHPSAAHQYYCLDYLWKDLQRAMEAGLPLLNLATEPIMVSEIATVVTSTAYPLIAEGQPARYDMRSIHAAHFGGSRGFMYNRSQVLADLERFVSDFRRGS